MLVVLAAAAALAVQEPPPVEISRENDLIAFSYSLPPRAAGIAPLRAAIARRMEQSRRRAVAVARQARDGASRGAYPYNRHSLAFDWRIEGSTPQLLSLSAEVTVYQGGGHAEDRADVLIWDRAAGRIVAPLRLLGPDAASRLMSRYCRNLRRAREDDGACPWPASSNVAPADTDGNGRFDTLRIFYTSSIYSEGRITVEIALEPGDLAAIPDGYRPAFELPGERRAPLPDE